MAYPAPPLAYCTGTWPAGPFARPPKVAAVPGDLVAVRAVAALVATVTATREERSWSRATLASRADLAPHTVGRIEAGQTWPDLATTTRLADALGLELTLLPARTPDHAAGDQPLAVNLTGVDQPSAAQIIEAILHNNPRIAGNVDTLRRRRKVGS